MKRYNLTHNHYRDILVRLKNTPYQLTTVRDYFLNKSESKKFIIIRHDVDRKACQSVRMAQLEASIGVFSSYYFRSSKFGDFPDKAIKAIDDLGHEVGYHYENLSQFNGDAVKAMGQFGVNLSEFRSKYRCDTICAHGKPLSRHNNFTQLLRTNLSEYGIIADASLSLAKDKLVYFTDTGGRWNIEPALNHRDYIGPPSLMIRDINPSNTDDFIEFMKSFEGSAYISTHPERWAHNTFFLVRAKSRDAVINVIKKVLKLIRLR